MKLAALAKAEVITASTRANGNDYISALENAVREFERQLMEGVGKGEAEKNRLDNQLDMAQAALKEALLKEAERKVSSNTGYNNNDNGLHVNTNEEDKKAGIEADYEGMEIENGKGLGDEDKVTGKRFIREHESEMQVGDGDDKKRQVSITKDRKKKTTVEEEAKVTVEEDKEEERAQKKKKNGELNNDGRYDQKPAHGTEIRWEDISDDETVVLQNGNDRSEGDGQWKIVKNKKDTKRDKDGLITEWATKQNQKGVNNEQTNDLERNTKTNKKNMHEKMKKTNKEKTNNKQDKVPAPKERLSSYLEITKTKFRDRNAYNIRITTSFTPRTASNSSEYKRLAREILEYAEEIDPKVVLLPWKENNDCGPINREDLTNPANLNDTIWYYFDKPSYVTLQPGSPAYKIGVHLSVNYDKHEFLDKWNIMKREFKNNHKLVYTINLAPMQKSDKAFIIGIAVGSTEDQDYTLLNERLEKETGIKGIEVSYQSINQAGITQEFWKIANRKAEQTRADKSTREYLRTKFLWAPSALAVYVPTKEMVNMARKIMLKKYGKANNGTDPVWPDGSTMRFLPIKGTIIKNNKTKEIVRK